MRRLAQLVLYNWTRIKEVGQWLYSVTLLVILSGSAVVLSMGALRYGLPLYSGEVALEFCRVTSAG